MIDFTRQFIGLWDIDGTPVRGEDYLVFAGEEPNYKTPYQVRWCPEDASYKVYYKSVAFAAAGLVQFMRIHDKAIAYE